jgi:signal transduction histidine kinase
MPDKIAALEHQLANTSELREKVELRIQLAMELRFGNLDRAIAMCEDAEEMAAQMTSDGLAYQEGVAKSKFTLGNLYLQASEYNQAFAYFSSALDLYGRMDKQIEVGNVLNAMGAGHYYLGGYVEALDFYLQALSIFQDSDQPFQEAKVLNNVGKIHLSANEVLRSLNYFEQSLQICEQFNLLDTKAEAIGNISAAYIKLDDLDLALDYCLQSVNLFDESGDIRGQASALNSLGDVYQVQGEFDKALESYHRSLDLSKRIGNRYEMAQSLQKLGEIYRLQGLPDQVLSALQQALVIAEEIGARKLQFECHLTLAEIYKQLGDYKKALTHFESYDGLKEEIFNDEADQRLKQLEITHQVETSRKEAEISRLRYGELQKEIMTREQAIDDLNAFAHMVAHDLKNPLQALKVSSYYLLKNIDDSNKEVVEAIQRTGDKMNSIVDELLVLASVRQQDVVPEELAMGVIVEEAKTRISSLIQKSGAQIHVPSYWPLAMGYAPWIEEVWDNYLSNAIKYGGKPPHLELGADELEGGYVCFWVRDDGDGIPQDEQERLFGAFSSVTTNKQMGHGLGLSIVKRIVEKLGGEVWVESSGEPGQGSVFSFTLPAAKE